MNDKVYIQHLYERLTQNAGPLALHQLAERLRKYAGLKLAIVHITVFDQRTANADSLVHRATLEAGTPLISALEQVSIPENAVVYSCLYAHPTFGGNVNVTPDTLVVVDPVTDYRGEEHPQHYYIYLQIGGDTEKATKNLGSVIVTVKFAIKYPNQDLHGGPKIRHMDIHLKDGETLGNALDRAKVHLETEKGLPMVVTSPALVKNETAKTSSTLRTELGRRVIVGQYYTIAVDVEKLTRMYVRVFADDKNSRLIDTSISPGKPIVEILELVLKPDAVIFG